MTAPRSRTRSAVRAGAGAVILACAVVYVWSAAVTSSATVRASTGTSGLLTAGDVRLRAAGSIAGLGLRADGLYPGAVVEECVDVAYDGTLTSSLRLHAEVEGGTGLERYAVVAASVTTGCDVPPAPASSAVPAFTGTLAELAEAHPDFDRGLVLDPRSEPGDRSGLWVEATIVDDDEAQGLTTDFRLYLEARP